MTTLFSEVMKQPVVVVQASLLLRPLAEGILRRSVEEQLALNACVNEICDHDPHECPFQIAVNDL